MHTGLPEKIDIDNLNLFKAVIERKIKQFHLALSLAANFLGF